MQAGMAEHLIWHDVDHARLQPVEVKVWCRLQYQPGGQEAGRRGHQAIWGLQAIGSAASSEAWL